jgi:hypothetical protein
MLLIENGAKYQVNYLQCKDVPAERLYDGCDVFIAVN